MSMSFMNSLKNLTMSDINYQYSINNGDIPVLFEVSVVHIKYKIQLLDVNLFWNEVLRSIAYQVKYSSRANFFVEPERFILVVKIFISKTLK